MMINQPRENEPLSSRPMQCAASVMVEANKWLPACVAEDNWTYQAINFCMALSTQYPAAKRGFVVSTRNLRSCSVEYSNMTNYQLQILITL